jgi:hypothetical protein
VQQRNGSDNVKNARPQKTGTSAGKPSFYIGNPRECRTLEVLLKRGETSRHDLDSIVGAENSPDLVIRLRNRGFDLPCERREFIDRDGQKVRVGIYSLSSADRPKAIAALKCEG